MCVCTYVRKCIIRARLAGALLVAEEDDEEAELRQDDVVQHHHQVGVLELCVYIYICIYVVQHHHEVGVLELYMYMLYSIITRWACLNSVCICICCTASSRGGRA